MKKIVFLVLGAILLFSCSERVAVVPEKRENFCKNPYFKSEEWLKSPEHETFKRALSFSLKKDINLVTEKDIEEDLEKLQYNSMIELLKKYEGWEDERIEKFIKQKKNNELIRKIEKNAKSKFSMKRHFISSYSSNTVFYFTSVDTDDFGKKGKYNIIEVVFDNYEIKSIIAVDIPEMSWNLL